MKPLLAALADIPCAPRCWLVAFSGGLDSTALLHALAQVQGKSSLHAVHVCHHLQLDAQAWARHCERQAAAIGAAFTRVDVTVDTCGRSMESAARSARYAALADIVEPGDVVVTAHHADDQAETFLIQALRGAGPRGLAGMPELATLGAGYLWRPWRHVERHEIRAYAMAAGLEWIEDPSNDDVAIDRGYLRQRVWPALKQRWPAAARTLSRSAAWAAEAAEAIGVLAELDCAQAATDDGGLHVVSLHALSAARCGEALRYWIASADRDRPDHRHLDQILRLLDAGERNGPCVAYAGTEIRRFNGRLYVMPRLRPVPTPCTLAFPAHGPLALPADAGELSATGIDEIAKAALEVTFRRGGERLTGSDGHTRALKDILREARLPPWIRARLPLIYRRDTLIAVADRWRHPALDADGPRAGPVFVWRHSLVGDNKRVVGNRAFG